MDNKLSDEQIQYKELQLEQGYAFEEMVRTKGWSFIKQYITEQIQEFTNDALNGNSALLEKALVKRSEIVGLQKLLNHIITCVDFTQNERQQDKRSS